MNHAVYRVILRDRSNLPINIMASEGRMKLLELLAPHLDVHNITFERVETPTKKERT